MVLDTGLLDQARAAEGRLIDAERNADVARADFHHAVRRLQLAGGSLREIADALGLSHQRVHQIVEGAGGSRPWRIAVRRPRGAAKAAETAKGIKPDSGLLCCSFCGKSQKQVKKLIAGPGIYICNECIAGADQAIVTGEAAATPLSAITSVSQDVTRMKCSFCGKRRHQVSGLTAAAGGTICNECLALCHEIIAEELE